MTPPSFSRRGEERRHTYRLGTFFTSFTVIRVDYKLERGENEWTTLWDAKVGFAYKAE